MSKEYQAVFDYLGVELYSFTIPASKAGKIGLDGWL